MRVPSTTLEDVVSASASLLSPRYSLVMGELDFLFYIPYQLVLLHKHVLTHFNVLFLTLGYTRLHFIN